MKRPTTMAGRRKRRRIDVSFAERIKRSNSRRIAVMKQSAIKKGLPYSQPVKMLPLKEAMEEMIDKPRRELLALDKEARDSERRYRIQYGSRDRKLAKDSAKKAKKEKGR